jgi:hypothetical protein
MFFDAIEFELPTNDRQQQQMGELNDVPVPRYR